MHVLICTIYIVYMWNASGGGWLEEWKKKTREEKKRRIQQKICIWMCSFGFIVKNIFSYMNPIPSFIHSKLMYRWFIVKRENIEKALPNTQNLTLLLYCIWRVCAECRVQSPYNWISKRYFHIEIKSNRKKLRRQNKYESKLLLK